MAGSGGIFEGNDDMASWWSADYFEHLLRMVLALVCGAAIGLNRFLRHKSAGMRTHALVAMGSAMAVMVFADNDAISRVAQGVLTGVGFIGAGVIMRDGESHVQGLTTAASVWVCAILGLVCGAGELMIAGSGVLLTLLTLIVGRPIERYLAHLSHDEAAARDKSD